MSTVTVQRNCEHCGTLFTPARSDARFHTDACRTAAGRAKRTEPNRTRSAKPAPQAAAVPASRTETALAWEPVTARRQVHVTDEPCPDCGTMLLAEPQGTWRACRQCRCPVVPAAVLAPYAGGRQGSERRVVSQRERDLASIKLERRRGLMLSQLAALSADTRLHPESVPVVDWLAAEVRAAKSETRLDELAELPSDPAAGIRRRHWWHSDPPAIGTACAADDGQDDDDDDDLDDDEPAVALPAPAAVSAPPELTAAAALDMLGYRLSSAIGGCQVIERDTPCDTEARLPITDRTGRHAWICSRHNEAIGRLITRRERELRKTRRPR